MKQILILLILLLAVVVSAQAQDKNPYAQFGYKGKVLKTPQGNYGTLRITAPKKDADYQPFGKAKAQGTMASGGYRYGFNGMEKDDELKGTGNSYDFGARLYDSRLGRWGSVDPERQFAASQYHAFGNNPVLLIDIDGGWVPALNENGRIILTAEEGDVLEDLYSFFGGQDNAKKYLQTVWTNKKTACNFQIKTGQKIRFNRNNVYSEGIVWNEENVGFEHEDIWKNTTCHGVALLGSREQSLIELGGEGNFLNNIPSGVRDKIIEKQYNEISKEQDGTFDFEGKGVVGETIITFENMHSAVYFGSDRNGTDYFLSKHNKGGYTIDTYEKITNQYKYEVKAYAIKPKYKDRELTNRQIGVY